MSVFNWSNNSECRLGHWWICIMLTIATDTLPDFALENPVRVPEVPPGIFLRYSCLVGYWGGHSTYWWRSTGRTGYSGCWVNSSYSGGQCDCGNRPGSFLYLHLLPQEVSLKKNAYCKLWKHPASYSYHWYFWVASWMSRWFQEAVRQYFRDSSRQKIFLTWWPWPLSYDLGI